MYALQVKNVSQWFGQHKVLNQVSFEIEAGQIVSIVGPSGCGKSTLLRAILGTHPPKSGEVWTSGRRVDKANRDVGIVYQHYALYEFLTALKNVAIGPMLDETNLAFRLFFPWKWRPLRAQHLARAQQYLEKVHLPNAAYLYPHEMSGGMCQRVAIAQALVMRPQVLLLDEPFGALDESTREGLQTMLLQLNQENLTARNEGRRPPFTIVIVTHELNEALFVADRVIGLSQYHQDGHNGASVVYDKAAPVFDPKSPRDFTLFTAQKEEIRQAVFDAQHLQHHSQFVSYWQDRKSAEENRAKEAAAGSERG